MADKRRRKSLKIFQLRSTGPSASAVSSTTSTPIETPVDENPHMRSPLEKETDPGQLPARPRVYQRTQRSSFFESLRTLHSLEEDEKILIRSDSKASSIQDDATGALTQGLFGKRVYRCAEVQIPATNAMFKKRTYFVLLTESHLVRFKNQQKAAEMFPIIPSVATRGHMPRTSTGSLGSYADLYTNHQTDVTRAVPLHQIVAVYTPDDGRPYFSVEVAYLDEDSKRGLAMQLSFAEPREAVSWINAIRAAVFDVREEQNVLPTQQHILDYSARILERNQDYDPDQLHVFKAVNRSGIKTPGRGSSDDLTKLGTTMQYLAIGNNKVHLIPLRRSSGRSSSTSLTELETPSTYGVMSLVSIQIASADDGLQLCFRSPLQQLIVLSLASNEAVQIALWLRYTSEYLRPEWTVQPFTFIVPQGVEDQMDPPRVTHEDNGCFDRTLVAFCAAYNVDPSRICYSVDYECDDSPCFRLLPPLTGYAYTVMELLAVLRSLRYNETFTTLSFADIDLKPLSSLYDPYGPDDDGLSTRSGVIVQIPGQAELSVLQQEIRALALKSRRLRRLDFTNTQPVHLVGSDPIAGCGIPEAVVPLCKRSLTNVDWLVLNGVKLSERDLNFLVDAASERQCHLRALEIAESGLSVQEIDVLLSALSVQEGTVEVINIAGAQGRFSPELFHRSMGAFSRIRKLNLTRVQKTGGAEPLLAPEILFEWKLESLYLNQSTLNEQSIDCISAYLASPKSAFLKELSMNQCGLTGRDLAVFLQSMVRRPGEVREIHISANENRLGQNCSLLSKCIGQGYAPSSLSMRMMDFEKEQHFRELVVALSENKTIRHLDISRASLPYDAGTETCEALKEMFAVNDTLETLDIGGEVSHLDTTPYGIGLNIALLGLVKNRTLRQLRVEHQKLGMQGANTLAEVFEGNNTLVEIHCEHNEINLQSFTVLVNALRKNEKLLYVPDFAFDKERFMARVNEEIEAVDQPEVPASPKTGGLRKSIQALSHVSRHHRTGSTASARSTRSFNLQDINTTIAALEEQWQAQTTRLHDYLQRNLDQVNGQLNGEDEDEGNRPRQAMDAPDRLTGKVKIGDASSTEQTVSTAGSGLREKKPVVFSLPND